MEEISIRQGLSLDVNCLPGERRSSGGTHPGRQPCPLLWRSAVVSSPNPQAVLTSRGGAHAALTQFCGWRKLAKARVVACLRARGSQVAEVGLEPRVRKCG